MFRRKNKNILNFQNLYIYAGSYLLVTKNGRSTTYKIKTVKTKLEFVKVAGDYLVLAGSKGYDYYVPISTVKAVCKQEAQ